MKTLTVSLKERSYPIHIGCDFSIDALENGAVVTDENVYRLYKTRVDAVAGGANRVAVVPPGEAGKSPEQLIWLWRFFASCGLNRHSPVAAVGGGVIGDLAGFAAASYMRGVPYVQIPTTLLAQTDSSVGGKVAVNLPEGKNLAGHFYQPGKVWVDISFLATLPPREIKTGLGEVVKHAMLDGGRLMTLLEQDLTNQTPSWEEIVYENVRIKARYVESDERESGSRMFLNLGHTFGHALELHTAYRQYNHGEAVAIGMVLAVRAGVVLGITAPETLEVLTDVLKRHQMPCSTSISPRDYLPLTRGDKKNSGSDITLILLKKIGEPVSFKLPYSDLEKLFL